MHAPFRSPARYYEDRLFEFFSVKVPDGPLTSRLQHLEEGDSVLVGRKPTGTLLLDNLREGRNLFLLGTGTGLAPYLSLVKDPETYERFERVVVVHGCPVATRNSPTATISRTICQRTTSSSANMRDGS